MNKIFFSTYTHIGSPPSVHLFFCKLQLLKEYFNVVVTTLSTHWTFHLPGLTIASTSVKRIFNWFSWCLHHINWELFCLLIMKQSLLLVYHFWLTRAEHLSQPFPTLDHHPTVVIQIIFYRECQLSVYLSSFHHVSHQSHNVWPRHIRHWQRCNWLSLFLSSLKEAYPLKNCFSSTQKSDSNLNVQIFLTVSYIFSLASNSWKDSRISFASSLIQYIGEETLLFSSVKSRLNAILYHSNLLIQYRPPFWLVKGGPFGRLTTWPRSHVSRGISCLVTLQSTNTNLL